MMEHSENLFRLGTESAFEVLARAQALSSKGKNIINLGIGQPDSRDDIVRLLQQRYVKFYKETSRRKAQHDWDADFTKIQVDEL